jgi:hypothetical protein
MAFSLAANEGERSVNEAQMVGIGRYSLLDSYLSPGQPMHYTGTGIGFLSERMKMTPLADYRISRNQYARIDLALANNPSGAASTASGFLEYSLGYHRHFRPTTNLKLLAGLSAHGLLGFLYNTRNGNNPATVKADIDLNLSAMAIYRLVIGNYPLTLRYRVEAPFVGIFFAPHYGQSYYEIFDLGNDAGVLPFASLHNKQAVRNLLTVDFGVGPVTLRTGYLYSYYRTDVYGIQSRIASGTFLLGIVREFVSFSGKRLKNTQHYRSAYY